MTPAIVALVAQLAEAAGSLSAQRDGGLDLRQRRANRIRTIHGSLAIEGNMLSESQITAILHGKRVVAPPREILEARNAIEAYEQLEHWQPRRQKDLLAVMQDDMSRETLQGALGLQDRKSFRERYLSPALAAGLIEMRNPDKPNSRLQKYRPTAKGRALA